MLELRRNHRGGGGKYAGQSRPIESRRLQQRALTLDARLADEIVNPCALTHPPRAARRSLPGASAASARRAGSPGIALSAPGWMRMPGSVTSPRARGKIGRHALPSLPVPRKLPVPARTALGAGIAFSAASLSCIARRSDARFVRPASSARLRTRASRSSRILCFSLAEGASGARQPPRQFFNRLLRSRLFPKPSPRRSGCSASPAASGNGFLAARGCFPMIRAG